MSSIGVSIDPDDRPSPRLRDHVKPAADAVGTIIAGFGWIMLGLSLLGLVLSLGLLFVQPTSGAGLFYGFVSFQVLVTLGSFLTRLFVFAAGRTLAYLAPSPANTPRGWHSSWTVPRST